MGNKFKTPHVAYQNTISFTCSDDAIEPLIELFGKLRSLGQMGSSKEVKIDWDGDGTDRLENISVNGMTLSDWDLEWIRLDYNKKFQLDVDDNTSNEQKENE